MRHGAMAVVAMRPRKPAKKMAVGIFYFTTTPKPRKDYTAVGRGAYVRLKRVMATDLGEALDQADPRPGESVMNTHELRAGGR